MAGKKKNKAIDELKEALKKEHKFYSNIGAIRFLIRVSVFSTITLTLFFFDKLALDEMVFVFLALILIEYLRFRKK